MFYAIKTCDHEYNLGFCRDCSFYEAAEEIIQRINYSKNKHERVSLASDLVKLSPEYIDIYSKVCEEYNGN